jgi:nickel-type superoxide dismutase maturation protease
VPRPGTDRVFRRGGPFRRAAFCLAGALGLAGIGLAGARWWRGRFRAYLVEGDSMLPALAAGDYVLVDLADYRKRPPRPDDVVLARDPRDPSRSLVKRVQWLEPDGSVWVLGDNPARSTDSRTFGAIPPDLILGRLRRRYWRSGG